ncbi:MULTISPECIES: hypothetical protein [unclassified Kribbella]|uniref:hypothetical protein n=1 Tax=unclassified Kribbella TaxID=2644121 RepID=UPI00301AC3D4
MGRRQLAPQPLDRAPGVMREQAWAMRCRLSLPRLSLPRLLRRSRARLRMLRRSRARLRMLRRSRARLRMLRRQNPLRMLRRRNLPRMPRRQDPLRVLRRPAGPTGESEGGSGPDQSRLVCGR